MDDITSSVQDVNEVTKQIKVSIPAAMVDREIDLALNGLVTEVKVKGFRKGKAPRHLVEKSHLSRVRMEVANKLISSSLNDVVKKLEVDMIGNPEIDVSTFEPDKDIQYTASISLFPKPEIKKYDKFKVSVPKREITDKDIDTEVENLLKSKSTLRKLEFRNVAQAKDVIDATMVATIEGGEPGKPEPLVTALGEGQLVEDLEKGIIGLEVGQTKEIESVIPDNFREETLRGKKATYKVTLNGLSERVVPELTDDFAKSLELNVGSVLELRLKIRELIEQEIEKAKKSDVQAAVLEQLLEANPFMVPQVIVDDEIKALLYRYNVIDPSKVDPDRINVEPFREKLGETALKRCRTAIVVDRIGRQENVEATKEDLEKSFQELADANGLSVKDVQEYFSKEGRLPSMVADISRNKVLDMLASRAEVTWTDPVKPEQEKKA